jgi:hypothetical protein
MHPSMFRRLCDLVDSSPARQRPYAWNHVRVWELADARESMSLRRRESGLFLKIYLVSEHAKDVFISKKGKHLFLCNIGKQICIIKAERCPKGTVTVWMRLPKAKEELAQAAVEFFTWISFTAKTPTTIYCSETESDDVE